METNNSRHLEQTQDFNVPVNQLYSAWIEPDQLKRWWKPLGKNIVGATNEMMPGGRVSYIIEDDLIISGTYDEVVENKKLIYSWNWEWPRDPIRNASFTLTITFTTTDKGSNIHVLQDRIENNETIKIHEEGWIKGLHDLEAYLNDRQGTTKSELNESTAGYREVPEQVKVAGG